MNEEERRRRVEFFKSVTECPECGSKEIFKYEDLSRNKFVISCDGGTVAKEANEIETPSTRKNYTQMKLEAEICTLIEERYLKKGKCGFAIWETPIKCYYCGAYNDNFDVIEPKSKKTIYICKEPRSETKNITTAKIFPSEGIPNLDETKENDNDTNMCSFQVSF